MEWPGGIFLIDGAQAGRSSRRVYNATNKTTALRKIHLEQEDEGIPSTAIHEIRKIRLTHPARPASTPPPPPSHLPPRSVEPYPAVRLDPMAPATAHEVPDLMAPTAAAVPQEAKMAAWEVSPRCGQIQLAAGN
ncbi:unnamed protein product [Urochloa humidicola]